LFDQVNLYASLKTYFEAKPSKHTIFSYLSKHFQQFQAQVTVIARLGSVTWLESKGQPRVIIFFTCLVMIWQKSQYLRKT